MDTPNFSLILPSRERLDLLRGLLTSIRDTANVDLLETWIAIDEDDTPSLRAINLLTHQFPFARFVIVPRQNNFSIGYYNRLAQITTGKYIWALNDDCLLTNPDWDVKALEHFEQNGWKDGIYYCRTHDDLGTGYSCFPMLSRRALGICGWVFHPEFTSWGGDINTHQMWSQTGRILDCPMLTVKHLTHHNHTRERDGLNIRVGQLARYNWGCASGEANRLRNIIAQG